MVLCFPSISLPLPLISTCTGASCLSHLSIHPSVVPPSWRPPPLQCASLSISIPSTTKEARVKSSFHLFSLVTQCLITLSLSFPDSLVPLDPNCSTRRRRIRESERKSTFTSLHSPTSMHTLASTTNHILMEHIMMKRIGCGFSLNSFGKLFIQPVKYSRNERDKYALSQFLLDLAETRACWYDWLNNDLNEESETCRRNW